MKKLFLLVCALALAAGCAVPMKRFSVVVEPPDAEITVIPGGDRPAQKVQSPATISIPAEQDATPIARMEVRREGYRPKTVNLAALSDGQAISIQMEKRVHYSLKLRLAGPQISDDLRYRDRLIAASFAYQDRQIDISLQNVSGKQLKILWERAEYLDHLNKSYRMIPTTVRPQDRNNAINPQLIGPGETVTVGVIPVSSIYFSQQKRAYEYKPLMPVDTDAAPALQGRSVYLFLPIEMDRQIIPYNFRLEVVEVNKDL